MNFLKKVIFSLIILLNFSDVYSLPESVISEISAMAKQGHIAGMSIVYIDERSPQAKYWSYGYSDLNLKKKTTKFTKYQLASLSKSYTGLAVATLINAKKISLSTKISRYLPNLRVQYHGKQVPLTIGNLLYQTSGIPDYTISYFDQTKSFNDMVSLLSKTPLDFKPGTKFEYCSVNYALLGKIIEKITGMTYIDYMRMHVFQPLGLMATGFPLDDEKTALGYKISFNLPVLYTAPDYELNYPGGYIVSNAIDIAKWMQWQIYANKKSENSLSKLINMTQQANTTFYAEPENKTYYAMGWFIMPNQQINHTGINPNFASYIQFDKKKHVGVVILANTNSPMVYKIGDYLIAYLAHNETADIAYGNVLQIDFYATMLSAFFGLFILLILYRFFKLKFRLEKRDRVKSTFYIILLPFVFIFISYFFPVYVTKFSWTSIWVWYPYSVILLWFEFLSFIFLFILLLLLKRPKK